MTDGYRHWHWTYRCGDFRSAFAWPTREAAQDAAEHVVTEGQDIEVWERPCTCGEPIRIGELL